MAQDGPLAGETDLLGHKDKSHKLFSKVACAGCRAIKVKCRLASGELPTGEEGESCTRCTRLSIPCEYKSATRRGRKPKSLIAAEAAAAQEQATPDREIEEPADIYLSKFSLGEDHLRKTKLKRLTSHPGQTDARARSTSSTRPEHATQSLPVTSTSQLPMHSTPMTYLPTPRSHPHHYPSMSPTMPPQPPTFPAPSPYSTSQPLGPPPPPPPPSHVMPSLSPGGLQPPRCPTSISSQASSYTSHPTKSPGPQASPDVVPNVRIFHSTAEALADVAATKSSSFSSRSPRPFISSSNIRPMPTHPDPIDLHVLSSIEAAQLFELFHSRLNCFIILLDRELHTPDYVRKTSTVLFTAILAVAAKFFRADLYQSLLLSAQQLVVRGTGEGVNVHIGLIQACLLLVYWKEPLDGSAWIRTGFALRAAYQLGLHVKRRTPLPEDEFEARLILDRERTFITLICFDASYQLSSAESGVYETRMVTSHDIDIAAWLEETRPYGVRDDWEQGASISLLKVLCLLPSIASATSKVIANSIVSLVNEMLAAVYSKYLDPSSPSYQELSTLAQHKIRFHFLAASVQVGKSCLAAAGVTDLVVLADFISRCGSLVDCFEDLTAGESPVFLFMQDNISIQLMGFGEMIGKLFVQVTPGVQTTLVEHLTRMYSASTNAARGDESSIPAYVSRFFRAVLRSIHPLAFRSTPPTRSGTPGPSSSAFPALTAQANPFEQLGSVEQELLLPDVPSLVTSLRNDGSYWDSLFPGQSSWSWLDNALNDPATFSF
ncbi:uncharacterized protein JCM15063_002171 [Sporobolomyces koalae]|uniref:uncharacterized protein n=1 Tax=Sporobolomyces koalae TaxID=500713 RepID=UPI00318058F2